MSVSEVFRARRGTIAGSLVLCSALLMSVAAVAKDARQTIGFVLTEWHLATYESPDGKAECPLGFQYGNVDNWEALYKTQAERDKMSKEHGVTQNRGKNGENVFVYPETGYDPLPFREIQSKIAYGQDLDGVPSGQTTSKTCAHENFTGPDGRKDIDNQLYRVLGCQKALRRGGFFDARFSEEKKMRLAARWLVEISDVDDLENDDHVVISTYKGLDKLVSDANQKTLPWGSQRVDERGARYMQRTTGKIVNGVLQSDEVDLLFSTATHNLAGETAIKHAKFELKLSELTAEGLIVGYHDLDQWKKQYAKQSMSREHVTPVSAPSVYQAAVRLADGDKDETTGRCTSISAAYDVKFTRAFIVHPDKNPEVAAIDVKAHEGASSPVSSKTPAQSSNSTKK